MNNTSRESQWITIVLITAVIMLVFLVFYGNRSHTTIPNSNKVETPATSPASTPTKPQDATQL
jgi:bacteriorhodopsin